MAADVTGHFIGDSTVCVCVCVCLFDWGITAQIYCHFSVFRSMECDKLHATSQRL